jgi:methylenetetrahydrofolate dehydrogenase (NADP+)/methenyltetrahydrofolate cyclohydrolase
MTANKYIGARRIYERIMSGVRQDLVESSAGINITTVHIGQPESYHKQAEKYASSIAKQLNIGWNEKVISKDTNLKEIYATISSLNLDPRVTGCIIARPLPANFADVIETIHPLKDVEGMHPLSIGNVVYGENLNNCLLPCTATASVELMKQAAMEREIPLEGMEILVVGSSDYLAKPICSLLHAAGATVSIIPHDNPKLPAYAMGADAVFLAVNKRPNFVFTGDMIKPDGILIDIGFNVLDTNPTSVVGTDGRKKYVVGDADMPSCMEKVSKTASIAHGIGLVRTAILFENILKAYKKQQSLL